MKNHNYSFLNKFEQEEKEKLDFQKSCTHTFWSTRCGVCSKVLASDHHINYHTPKTFKKDNKVALMIVDTGTLGDIDLYRIQDLYKVRQDFDELIVLVDSLEHLEAYSAIKYADKVNFNTLEDEVKHLNKYRREDIVEVNLIMYPDTLESQVESYKTKLKTLKISSKILVL